MVEVPKNMVKLLRHGNPVKVVSPDDDSRVSIYFEDEFGELKSVAFWGVDHITVQPVRTVKLPTEDGGDG